MTGKRFAEIEFVTCLVMVVQNWTIHLKDEWTEKQVWDVLEASVSYTTMRPGSNIPLHFRKRSKTTE
jgi:hypothetical protein